ncbi:hypothetical protein FD16_GL002461 [Paucilactobacillus suebicus DSM 5007 = KCTC 3549]|uniref:Uncharacterized protein n=1 Tax=Paucilactobacillus suebicus DSM 5007 = KCTC 3549 TaxID=1423807 RepID=A0A0R1W8S6_9LACO|nr:hypothetical protein FD16_GL002461 [Paucilactobacillus suebicus DSM 5007 = KCTC 3549]
MEWIAVAKMTVEEVKAKLADLKERITTTKQDSEEFNQAVVELHDLDKVLNIDEMDVIVKNLGRQLTDDEYAALIVASANQEDVFDLFPGIERPADLNSLKK